MAQALGARAAGVTTILVVTLAALTGCGGDDDTTAGDAESSSSQTSGTTPSSPAETSATNPTSSTDSTATETEITGTGSETPGSTGPAVDPAALAGRWTREVDDPCGRRYPISLDFAEHVYTVELDPAEAPVIDSGDYELVDDSTLRLTAPNDAMVSFDVELSDDQFVITDGDGCRVTYRR